MKHGKSLDCMLGLVDQLMYQERNLAYDGSPDSYLQTQELAYSSNG